MRKCRLESREFNLDGRRTFRLFDLEQSVVRPRFLTEQPNKMVVDVNFSHQFLELRKAGDIDAKSTSGPFVFLRHEITPIVR